MIKGRTILLSILLSLVLAGALTAANLGSKDDSKRNKSKNSSAQRPVLNAQDANAIAPIMDASGPDCMVIVRPRSGGAHVDVECQRRSFGDRQKPASSSKISPKSSSKSVQSGSGRSVGRVRDSKLVSNKSNKNWPKGFWQAKKVGGRLFLALRKDVKKEYMEPCQVMSWYGDPEIYFGKKVGDAIKSVRSSGNVSRSMAFAFLSRGDVNACRLRAGLEPVVGLCAGGVVETRSSVSGNLNATVVNSNVFANDVARQAQRAFATSTKAEANNQNSVLIQQNTIQLQEAAIRSIISNTRSSTAPIRLYEFCEPQIEPTHSCFSGPCGGGGMMDTLVVRGGGGGSLGGPAPNSDRLGVSIWFYGDSGSSQGGGSGGSIGGSGAGKVSVPSSGNGWGAFMGLGDYSDSFGSPIRADLSGLRDDSGGSILNSIGSCSGISTGLGNPEDAMVGNPNDMAMDGGDTQQQAQDTAAQVLDSNGSRDTLQNVCNGCSDTQVQNAINVGINAINNSRPATPQEVSDCGGCAGYYDPATQTVVVNPQNANESRVYAEEGAHAALFELGVEYDGTGDVTYADDLTNTLGIDYYEADQHHRAINEMWHATCGGNGWTGCPSGNMPNCDFGYSESCGGEYTLSFHVTTGLEGSMPRGGPTATDYCFGGDDISCPRSGRPQPMPGTPGRVTVLDPMTTLVNPSGLESGDGMPEGGCNGGLIAVPRSEYYTDCVGGQLAIGCDNLDGYLRERAVLVSRKNNRMGNPATSQGVGMSGVRQNNIQIQRNSGTAVLNDQQQRR